MVSSDVILHHIVPYLEIKELVKLCSTCKEFQKWLTKERWNTALERKWDMYLLEEKDNLFSGCAIAYGLSKEIYIALHNVKKEKRDYVRVVEIYDSERVKIKVESCGIWFDVTEFQLKIGIPNRARASRPLGS